MDCIFCRVVDFLYPAPAIPLQELIYKLLPFGYVVRAVAFRGRVNGVVRAAGEQDVDAGPRGSVRAPERRPGLVNG